MLYWRLAVARDTVDPASTSLMWEMFDPDFDCGSDCFGPGPPPTFFLPPPPRPPFMQEINTKCSEDPVHDADVCDAINVSRICRR